MVIWAVAASFSITAVSGLFLLPLLKRHKLGQSIREDGPVWHMGKSGTPTMGGLMFILGTTVSVVVLGMPLVGQGEYAHLLILAFAWLYGIIGFLDDFFKVAKHRNLGLSALQKLLLQLAVATLLLVLMHQTGIVLPEVYIPFMGESFPVEWIVYLIPAVIFVTGFVNAVNLTDGVDGLCSGVTLPVAVFFAVSCQLDGQTGLAMCASALAGGVAGFLIYNFHPARVFMGDTGALFLGGMVCGIALASGKPLLLILVGLIYLVEMFSVVLQVLYFKATKGKRLFRMSPLHHHFEMGGWGERKLFFVFTLATAAICTAVFFLA